MKCKQVWHWLPELAGGELGPREQALCEEHLSGCPDCQKRRDELAEVVSLLRRAGEAPPSPAETRLAQKLHWRLAQEPAPRRPLSARILGALGALGALSDHPFWPERRARLGLALGVAAAAAALLLLAPHTGGLPGPRKDAPVLEVNGQVPAPFQVPSRRVAVVHFDFVTDEVVDNVRFEVTLPQELAFINQGRPLAERTLRWSGTLSAGSNPIPLAVSGTKPGRYKIVARAQGEGVDVQHDVWLEVVRS